MKKFNKKLDLVSQSSNLADQQVALILQNTKQNQEV